MRDPLNTKRTQRQRLVDMLTGNLVRDAALVAAVNAHVTRSAITAVDANTFGYLNDAAGSPRCSILNGSKNLASTDAPWTVADVGKEIHVQGAGVAGATLVARIVTFSTASAVVLDTAASTTVSESSTSASGAAVWGNSVDAVIDGTPRINTDGSVAQSLSSKVLVGTTERGLAARFAEKFNVKDYGAKGDGVTDDTAAINACFAAAAGRYAVVLIPAGSYQVTQVVISNASGLTIEWYGLIVGASAGTYDAVVTIKNSSEFKIVGKPWIYGAYNVNYSCGLALYTDNATQVSNCDIYNITCAACSVAVRIGRSTEPSALLSEISFHGGVFYGCPTGVMVWGTQSIVSFNGSALMANSLGGDAGWQAITQYTLRVFGASVIINGGEFQHNQTSGGALIDLQPIVDPTYGHVYGRVHVIGTALESAAPYCVMQNTVGATPVAGSGSLKLIGNFGFHSQDSFAIIQGSASFTGSVTVTDNEFYCGVARTNVNANFAGAANWWIDKQSFGTNFIQGMKGVVGGMAHFSERTIIKASNTASQVLVADTPATLKFGSLASNDDTDRFAGNYSAVTGQFTAPHALRGVKVFCALRTDAPTNILGIDVYVAGGYAGSLPVMMGGAGNGGILSGVVEIGDVGSGSTIELKAMQTGVGSTCNFGAYEYMAIVASNP